MRNGAPSSSPKIVVPEPVFSAFGNVLWTSVSKTVVLRKLHAYYFELFSVEAEQFAYSICSIHDEFISLPSTILPFAYHFLLIYPSAISLIARPAFPVSHASFLRAQRARALRAPRALFPLLPSSSFAYLFQRHSLSSFSSLRNKKPLGSARRSARGFLSLSTKKTAAN